MQSRKIMLLMLMALLSQSEFTLEEYPEYEVETPQSIFYDIEETDEQLHPQIPKLVFVTPWNSEGKELTIKYAEKIDYVSPCWFELVIKNEGKSEQVDFENDQLVDREYIRDLRRANSQVKILPRVYLNSFEVLRLLGSNQGPFVSTIIKITKMVEDNDFDGLVWDSPYDLFLDEPNIRPISQVIAEMIKVIKSSFQSSKATQRELLLFFNMANPSGQKLNIKLYKELKIDGLLIQNYDGRGNLVTMVRESVSWVQKNQLRADTVVMMLPFFSYRNGQGTSSKEVAQELSNDNIAHSGSEKGLCKFVSRDKITYLVPCYQYFSKVYPLIQEYNMTAGFWEGGNGLENYYKFM